jgi:putative hydrolase of HD superfamily
MKKKKKPTQALLDFIFEAGMLKRLSRSGWQVVGIKNPESVADHSFRCAVIGYVLARMEKVKPYRVMLMTLFGDIQEARITDLHKMAQSYINIEPAEDKSFKEQISHLPKDIKSELGSLQREYRAQKSRESVVARDADILECLIQAKEYHSQGFLQASKFMKKAPKFLRSRSGRKIWQMAKAADISGWWSSLAEFKR